MQIHSAQWGAGAASPPLRKSWLWCGAAKPRRTTADVQYVLAQHGKESSWRDTQRVPGPSKSPACVSP